MRYLVLFLIFVPDVVFGTTFDDEWPIYVYGDASYYKLIYDGIAMIVQDNSFMQPMFKFIFGSSILFTAKSMYDYDIKGGMWNVTLGLGTTGMLLYPSATVHVLDVRTLHGYVQPYSGGTGGYSGYQKIDNIPFYLAAIPSLATYLKYEIIDISADALSPVDGGSFRDSGFATPMTLAENMISTASFKYSRDSAYVLPRFNNSLSHYIEHCVINEALYVDSDTIYGIMDPKGQQLDALQPSNFTGLSTVIIEDLDHNEVSCGTFWTDEIIANEATASTTLHNQFKDSNGNLLVDSLAEATAMVAGLEANASVALTKIQNAIY